MFAPTGLPSFALVAYRDLPAAVDLWIRQTSGDIPTVANEMKENRCREQYGVHPVNEATVTGDQMPPIPVSYTHLTLPTTPYV